MVIDRFWRAYGYICNDDYYSLEKRKYPKKSLRVRDKGKRREVNFKQWRSYKNGVWAKKEVEFEVSDRRPRLFRAADRPAR